MVQPTSAEGKNNIANKKAAILFFQHVQQISEVLETFVIPNL
jgi:hypothetical protein